MNNKITHARKNLRLAQKEKTAYVDCGADALLSKSELLTQLKSQQAELELQNRELIDAHELLECARVRYTDLYDNAPVTYITFNNKGYIQNINLAGTRLLGESRASAIGRPFLSWLENGNEQKFIHHLREVFTLEGKRFEQLEILDSENQSRTVCLESVAGIDSPVCRTIIFDITERVQAERQRDEQEHQLNMVTDALPIMIAYIDKEEKHQFVNRAYSKWYSLEKDEILGRSVANITGDLEYEKNAKYIQQAMNGEFIQFESYSTLNAGRESITDVTYIPDSGVNHDSSGFFVLMRDVTDLRITDARKNKQLSDSAHTARLSIMGEMVSEIAHELNQPLAAISIYSEACKRLVHSRPVDNSEITKSLDSIAEQAKRASDVIGKMRNFAIRKELQKSYVDINYVINDIIKLINVEVHWHNAKLDLNLEDNLPKMQIDVILIQQVILNLVRNAIEAMTDSQRTNRLIIISSRQKYDEIIVSVADQGSGISGHVAKHMFEPFISSKSGGMGMGLAICQSIIKAHKGRIWALSNKYGGATFNFTVLITGKGDSNGNERTGGNY